MEVQTGNTPADAGVDNDTLSLISALRNETAAEPEAAPETPPAAEPAAPSAEPAPEPEPAQEDTEAEAEARRNALLREIAMDPAQTQQYVQQQYYQQPPAQQAPQQQEPSEPSSIDEAFAQEFPGEDYDPYSLKHNAFIQRYNLQPFQEFVAQQEQENQQIQAQQQAQQAQQMAQQVNQKAVAFLDTYVPGFAAMAEKLTKNESLTAIERAVFNEAVNAESFYLQHYPQALYDVQLRAQIAQQIGPHLKKYASDLGLVSQPKPQLTPEAKQQIRQESYVEPSNAVPSASGASAFDKALERGDSLSMIRALRAT